MLDKYGSFNETTGSNRTSALDRARSNASVLLGQLDQLAPALLGGPLLDVGCASGELLHVLRTEHGWALENLAGLEPARQSCEFARCTYSLNIEQQFAETAEMGARQFGLIIVLNTMEHLSEPRRALAGFRRWLRDDGLLVLGNVPNSDCLMSRLAPCLLTDKNFPDGEHQFHYTPDTLTRLCEAEGFSAAACHGRLQNIAGSHTAETAAWISYGCGVPLQDCLDARTMLDQVRALLAPGRELTTAGPQRFDTALDLLAFWRANVWSTPRLSEAFWLWLRPDAAVKRPAGQAPG